MSINTFSSVQSIRFSTAQSIRKTLNKVFYDGSGTDGGTTWETSTIGPAINGGGNVLIKTSADGRFVYVYTSPDFYFLYKSTNYGITFYPVSAAQNGSCVGCNRKGDIVYIGSNGAGGSFLKSTDCAYTFTAITTPPTSGAACWDIATSFDGNIIYTVDRLNTVLYQSSDGGSTWTTTTTNIPNQPARVCCSDDGVYVLVSSYSGGGFALSQNSGATFTLVVEGETMYGNGAAMSLNGQYMIVVSAGGMTQISSDYGTTFTTLTYFDGIAGDRRGCCVSAYGKYMAVLGYNTANSYYSTDYGETWNTSTTTLNTEWGAAMSGTGQYIYTTKTEDGGYQFMRNTNYGR